MAEVILMPRLSDTMTEGVIAAWHKNIGDKVKKGDLLAEVETDKATMELESYKDGTLLHIGVDKGGKLQVNDLLAIIGAPGEDIASLIKQNQSTAGNQQSTAGSQQSAAGSQQSAAGSQQSTASNQQSTTSRKESGNGKPGTGIDISKMDEIVLMPRLSDTMTEGVISSWHKNVGDDVKKGDLLAEIETDKATMDLESYKNGKLLYIGAQKGEKIAVNELLCIIGEEGKVDVKGIVAAVNSQQSTVGSSQSAAVSQQSAAGSQQSATGGQQSAAGNQKISAAEPQESADNGRLKASPLAKKLAAEKGIDIKKVAGTGDGGRIIKADVDSFKEQSASSKQSTVSSQQPAHSTVSSQQPAASGQQGKVPEFVAGEEGYTDISNSQIRNIIAKRLGESKYSAPHFYLTMEINMDNAVSARAQLNEVSPVKISYNDIIVKAAALALREHPAVNASWMGSTIRRYHHIHIGIAVAIEDGLIVPVIRFADQKSLPQIAGESKELSGKARNKKLQPNEFTGNTFTISNLGMMDIDEFTAIINPPDSCIMAVGRIKEVVTRKAEGFGVSNIMKITLSCDHRSVDGATGAAFLQTFKKYMENPVMMLL